MPKCLKCGHEWNARTEKPKKCPKCGNKEYEWSKIELKLKESTKKHKILVDLFREAQKRQEQMANLEGLTYDERIEQRVKIGMKLKCIHGIPSIGCSLEKPTPYQCLCCLYSTEHSDFLDLLLEKYRGSHSTLELLEKNPHLRSYFERDAVFHILFQKLFPEILENGFMVKSGLFRILQVGGWKVQADALKK